MDFVEEKVEVSKINLEPHNNYVLIDADSIAYAAAYNAEGQSIELAESLFFNSIKYIMTRTGSSKAKIFFTKGRASFRYALYTDYKKPRLNQSYPALLTDLKLLLYKQKFDNVVPVVCEFWEADDEVVWSAKLEPGSVVAALDKDVLNSIAGKHYNIQKDDFVEVQSSSVKLWPYIQTVTGDSSDNIPGCYRIGPKKVANYINESMEEPELWQAVIKAYKDSNTELDKALLNMRLVNMHQLHEGKIVLWDPSYLSFDKKFRFL